MNGRRGPGGVSGRPGAGKAPPVNEPPTPLKALVDNRRYAWMVGVLAAVLHPQTSRLASPRTGEAGPVAHQHDSPFGVEPQKPGGQIAADEL